MPAGRAACPRSPHDLQVAEALTARRGLEAGFRLAFSRSPPPARSRAPDDGERSRENATAGTRRWGRSRRPEQSDDGGLRSWLKEAGSGVEWAGHGCLHTLWSQRAGGRTLLLELRSLVGAVGRADDGRGLD
jgi:hypothetical protein